MYSMCHFVMTVGADHRFIERICCYHALTVNSNELALLHTVYDAVAHQLGKDHKHLAAAVIMAGYSPEVVNVNARPTPDHCKLFLPSGIKNLVANKSMSTVLTAVEAMLKTAVDKHLPILAASSSPARRATW